MRFIASIFAVATLVVASPAAAQDINDVIDFEQNISAQAERFADQDDRHTQIVQTRDAQDHAATDADEQTAAQTSDRDLGSHDEMEGRKWGETQTRGDASDPR